MKNHARPSEPISIWVRQAFDGDQVWSSKSLIELRRMYSKMLKFKEPVEDLVEEVMDMAKVADVMLI